MTAQKAVIITEADAFPPGAAQSRIFRHLLHAGRAGEGE
jgi:hypothetical protein